MSSTESSLALEKLFEEVGEYINSKLPYLSEENRHSSFKNWIFNDNVKCNAKNMAEAGFIFCGDQEEPDAVRCFLCNKTLDCWEKNDDPWVEHVKHSPNCSFAKLSTPQEALTLSALLDLERELVTSSLRAFAENKVRKVLDKAFGGFINDLES